MRVVLLVVGLLAACGGGGQVGPPVVGRPCVNPGGVQVTSPQLSQPALECPSKICLIAPSGGRTVADCTATCAQDSDCVGESDVACAGGYACLPLVASCQKLCVCRDLGLAAATGC